ncbi:MaoC/PaaZ C-terminal domain-containing protein [uncultured Salinisphaera sp.]|uniref:MaoC/PaaZ C-terminal domain-containing protein n=1 Tax=uncultured Salinisphaera sp. TaxID=359372 RepID=UPI0032B27DFA
MKIHDAGRDHALENFHAGRPIERELILTQADFDRFAALCGDHNPIHVDPAYAARTRFGATVSHGMLLFAAVREFVACVFADSGLQAQTLKFPTPAYAEEPLRIELVGQGDAGDGVLALATRVVKLDGQLCLDGMCRVLTANGNGS